VIDLFQRRFVINTGKGGVGKTTISAAIALAASRRGKRVLLMEIGAKERGSRLFGAAPLGFEPLEVEENLFAIHVSPEAAFEEYAVMKLRLKALYRAVFANRFMRSFLRVIPGLNELTLLGKAWHEVEARNPRGTFRWDMVIVDAPATGHGIFFLKIPDVITSLVTTGPMVEECRRLSALLRNRRTTVLNLITLVEEMPVNETIELRAQLEEEFDVPLGFVVANAVYPPLFDADEVRALRRRREEHPRDGSTGDRLLEAGLFRVERVELQSGYLDRIDRELDLPQIRVPYYFTERFDFQTISKIADDIERQVAAHVGADSRE
jgi:anion-transporting  ArsA/GET3 family ATPase